LTTTRDTHPLYNLTWCWCGQDKWRVKNISAWHWEWFLWFTCLGFLSRTLSCIFHQGLRSSELESHISWILPLLSSLLSILDHRRSLLSILSPSSLTTVARHHRWSSTVARYRNHCHTKSPLCKWVHWTPISFKF